MTDVPLCSQWNEDVILTPNNDFVLTNCHHQIIAFCNNWRMYWANTAEYDPIYPKYVAFWIKCLNVQLRELGYLDEVWFDYDEQRRINNDARV